MRYFGVFLLSFFEKNSKKWFFLKNRKNTNIFRGPKFSVFWKFCENLCFFWFFFKKMVKIGQNSWNWVFLEVFWAHVPLAKWKKGDFWSFLTDFEEFWGKKWNFCRFCRIFGNFLEFLGEKVDFKAVFLGYFLTKICKKSWFLCFL